MTTKIDAVNDALSAFIETTEDHLDKLCERYKSLAMDAKLNVDDRMAMGHKAHTLREFKRKLRKLGD